MRPQPRPDSRSARWAVAAACLISGAIGLLFVFVRAPHPWGWQGFDHYDELARTLLRDGTYPTLDRVWGYPLVLAAFYRAFNGRVGPVLVAQVLLNALVPALLYSEIRWWVERRVAVVAALVTGLLSFNTIYASTQSSDALCTVATAAGILLVARAGRTQLLAAAAAGGLMIGIAAQLRPNLLLLSIPLAAALLWRRVPWRAAAALVVASGLVDIPWIVRNYEVSGRFIPATTHGGIQLWYGSLQAGQYFDDWTQNPAAAFEGTFFDYSPPSDRPVRIVAARNPCAPAALQSVVLEYRVNDGATISAAPIQRTTDDATFVIARPPLGSTLYFFVDARWANTGGETFARATPLAAADGAAVRFVAIDDLHDLDRGDDLLDAFDVIRMIRRRAWQEPGRGAVDDLNRAVGLLSMPGARVTAVPPRLDLVTGVDADATRATLRLADGSTVVVPKAWSGTLADVEIRGALATDIMHSRRSIGGLRAAVGARAELADTCLDLRTAVDQDFFVLEPQMDARYQRLAWTNIRRAPLAFAAASARRVVALFVVTTPRAARMVSLVLFVLAGAGVAIALRERLGLELFWLPLLYVPVTIAYMLTNMRYTVTVQPFQFVFVAIALDRLAKLIERRRAA